MNDRFQPTRLSISSARITGIGDRDVNQDAFGESYAAGIACYVMADGAGGHEGGAVAARTVVDSALGAFTQQPALNVETLNACVAGASDAVVRMKLAEPALASMHATLAVLLVDSAKARACWAHVGDTRIYLFRGGRVRHVTRDHSLAQQFIDAGLAKDTDPRTHAQRSVLYAAIGVEGQPSASIQPPLDLVPGDVLLVCTDGLWERVTETTMEACLARAMSADDWLAALCAAADATAAAGRDNFTGQVLWIAA